MSVGVVRASVDGGVIAVIVAALMNVVTPLAAVIGLVYYAIVLWETDTVQNWVRQTRQKHAVRKLAKLSARQKVIEAEMVAAETVRAATAAATERVAQAKSEAALLVAAPPLVPQATPPVLQETTSLPEAHSPPPAG